MHSLLYSLSDGTMWSVLEDGNFVSGESFSLDIARQYSAMNNLIGIPCPIQSFSVNPFLSPLLHENIIGNSGDLVQNFLPSPTPSLVLPYNLPPSPMLPLSPPSSMDGESSKGKKCICAWCGKELLQKNFKSHFVTHDKTRQKNYVCHASCGKAFYRKKDLKRHILEKHSSSN